jgi:hypothetical protein
MRPANILFLLDWSFMAKRLLTTKPYNWTFGNNTKSKPPEDYVCQNSNNAFI